MYNTLIRLQAFGLLVLISSLGSSYIVKSFICFIPWSEMSDSLDRHSLLLLTRWLSLFLARLIVELGFYLL